MDETPRRSPNVDLWDVVALIGIGLITYGTWLYDPRVTAIVAGAGLLALAIHRQRRRPR